jgi:endonuclease/exonuclease/phosphatase family metal-dependent hydrolase
MTSGTAWAKGSFCVGSFNAYGPIYAPDVEERAVALVDYLKGERPCDYLFLQELWRSDHIATLKAEIKKKSLKMELVSYDRGETSFGLALLSYAPPGKVTVLPYPVNYLGFTDWVRKILFVGKAVSVTPIYPAGHERPVNVVNTHLHHVSEAVRVAQLAYLGMILDDLLWNDLPVVVVGDFNARPDSLPIKILKYVYGLIDSKDPYKPGACTYCGKNPLTWSDGDKVYDYIFYRSTPLLNLKVQESQIGFKSFKGAPLSDHYGVLTQFDWVEPSGAREPLGDSAKAIGLLAEAITLMDGLGPVGLEAKNFYSNLKEKLQTDQEDRSLLGWFKQRTKKL